MDEFMQAAAIGNLSMLAQIASGEIKAKPGEVEEREAWLLQFIRTGAGLVTEEAEAMAARVRAALAPVAAEEEVTAWSA